MLWLHRDDPGALELMSEIKQRLKENEREQAKETVLNTRIYQKINLAA